MNEFAFAILIIFAIFGIVDFVKKFTSLIFSTKAECSIVIITPVKAKCENAELIIRNYAERLKWISKANKNCVLCVDFDMDKETEKICDILCKEYGFINIIKKSEINDFLKSKGS